MPIRKGREDRGAAGGDRPGTPPSSAILDTAFHTAYKATPRGETPFERARRRAMLKIVRASAVVVRHLNLAIRNATKPALTDFDHAMLDRQFGRGMFDRSARRILRAIERIRGLTAEEQRLLRKASDRDAFAVSVRRFYGRLASFTREVDPDLRFLDLAARFRRNHPRIDPESPVLAVAGFPNVGKSSLVARLSPARPKVAPYPFTTISLEIGHSDLGFDRLQVVDTPGVLNRTRRGNPSEGEAEVAVSRAATVVLFVLDPSESCGYSLDEQERLLARWRQELPNLRFLEVETKADLARRDAGRLQVSATTGEGIEALRAEIEQTIRAAHRPRPPPDSVEGDELVVEPASGR